MYEPRHKVRLAIKPGITGMWQVSGRSDITDFEEVVRLDKSLVIVLLISGLTETYAVSIHYVVGPVMYCLIRGVISQDNRRVHTR